MTISLSISQQIQHLSSLQNQQQHYLPQSSCLIFLQNKNQIIYHGYLRPKPSDDTKAQGQAANQQVKPKKKFVFKMGKDKDVPKANTQLTQKLNVYDINTNAWTQLEAKGKLPVPRENQQTLMLNQELLLMYGGKTIQTDKVLNDLHALNLQTLQWKKLFSIQGPPATQNSIIIKISETKIALVNFKQVWTFEAKEVKWQLNTNELPGGVWQNLNIKFDHLADSLKHLILGGICITTDLTFVKLLVFTCDEQTGQVSSFVLNLNEKQVEKVKLKQQITLNIDNLRHDFGCFEMGIDMISEEFNQAMLTVKTSKGNIVCYLTEYNQTTRSLNIISQDQSQSQIADNPTSKLLGTCLSPQPCIYTILFHPQNPRKKSLAKVNFIIRQNTSAVMSQVQKPLANQPSGYMNNMKSSQIQSIPEESNESSVMGMRSYPNEREEEFQEMENDNFTYQMRRNDKNKLTGSGPSSQVNRSPSALSDEIESDVGEQTTERNNQSLVRKNDQSIDQRSSFYNDSNVYVSSRGNKSPGQHQGMSNNNSSFPQEQHLQKTLEKILVYEHLKRQKLEQKSKFLQKAIQNSQPLAKLLTKYASSSQKARHIQNIKACKQELQTVWNKQVFYRRQMLQHFLPTESEILNRNEMAESGGIKGRSKELSRGKIDMGRLMRRHLVGNDQEGEQ